MALTMIDFDDPAHRMRLNSWHWRALVEIVRGLGVVSDEEIEAMEDKRLGLEREPARRVAVAIRDRVLPDLVAGERVMLDGSRMMEPDDGTFYREASEAHRNYSTNREVLEEFAAFCERCGGFEI